MLNADELDDGIRKGQSLANIARERTDAYQFTPTAGLELGDGLTGDLRPRHHYVTGVVAIDSMKVNRVVQELEARRTAGVPHLPNMVVCLSKKWIVAKAKRNEDGSLTEVVPVVWTIRGLREGVFRLRNHALVVGLVPDHR